MNRDLVERVGLIIARANMGSMYPGMGAENELPVEKHEYLAAEAIIPLILAEAAKVAREFNNWEYVRIVEGNYEPGSPYDRGQMVAARSIATAIEALGVGE